MANKKFQVENRKGDIFEDAPPGTIFIHSCNCKGAWGKGIALEFKKRYPEAHKVHRQHCSELTPNQLLGTSQIIPPPAASNPSKSANHHIIVCLFTKDHWGPTKSAAEVDGVVDATRLAMQHFLKNLAEMYARGELSAVGEIRMPTINAGLFKVPWERTLEVLTDLEIPKELDGGRLSKIMVYSR